MIAIVILNWNGKAMLEKYLPCLIKNTGKEAEIYVADNASTDDSLEWIANNAPQVKTIRLEKNWGFAEGYNKALKNIDAEYYLLLNSDVEVTEGWLEPMLSFMESNPEAAVCQPKIMDMYDRNKFEYSGACGGYLDKHCYPFCRGRRMAPFAITLAIAYVNCQGNSIGYLLDDHGGHLWNIFYHIRDLSA